jgi:hypothetical protein
MPDRGAESSAPASMVKRRKPSRKDKGVPPVLQPSTSLGGAPALAEAGAEACPHATRRPCPADTLPMLLVDASCSKDGRERVSALSALGSWLPKLVTSHDTTSCVTRAMHAGLLPTTTSPLRSGCPAESAPPLTSDSITLDSCVWGRLPSESEVMLATVEMAR